ncbi:MAG: class I SAM-dependent methyltransferase [Lachnospiraceae bacterium]|nr:class I SAM-dependent methyltransferase [Lachnospiraceae bacterium]
METYSDFAYCYDLFMDDIPYDDWAEYIAELLKKRGIEDGLVCELGCGTGEITMRLKENGYDMIGIDLSEDMLMVARDKMYEEDMSDILYLHQDMRDFELYGTVRAFVSVCDSMNYILTEEDLLKVFKNVNNYLDRDGLFIFDMKTAHFYENSYGNKTFSQEREEGVLVWENHYDKEKQLNSYDLTIDVFDPEENVYDEIKEHHVQRAYDIEVVKKLLEQAGLKFEYAYDAFTDKPVNETSDRIYVIAREGFQAEKKYI